MISHTNVRAGGASTGALEAPELAALLADWTHASHGTLPQQLAHALRRLIDGELVADGTRLPPERRVASALAVSRSTVTAAFDELRAEGLLASRQGSGTRVRSHAARTLAGSRVAEHFATAPGIDLAAGNPPDASHLPPVHLDVAALLAAGGGAGVQPLGLPALRSALAARHRAQGLLTDPEQIHVTAGAHQAIALAVGALAAPGSPVAVEDPSYPGIFDILDLLGARPVPVAADHAGLVHADLDRVLAEHRPHVLYVQTGPHNPTGRVPRPGRLRALAEVCDRHQVTVVEDCALADLTFAGRVRPELADLCRRAVVARVGSFSKVAWGGLRIGWLRAPGPLVERTMNLRLGSDLGPSVPAQVLALQLVDRLDDLAASRRAHLEGATAHALALLRRELPEWRVTPPTGGSVLWAELPIADTAAYTLLARRHGVHITPGSIATAARDPSPHVRLCVDRPPALVEEGTRRLGLAWRELHTTRPPALG